MIAWWFAPVMFVIGLWIGFLFLGFLAAGDEPRISDVDIDDLQRWLDRAKARRRAR